MAMLIPGVSVGETLLTSVDSDDPVTMPLFIGYCPGANKYMTLISVDSLAQALKLFTGQCTLTYSLQHFFDNGGRRCYVLQPGAWPGDDPLVRLQALVAALNTAELQEIIAADNDTGLLLAPELSELNDVDLTQNGATVSNLWYQGWQALLTLCLFNKQRFALLEMPESPEQAITLNGQTFSPELCQNGAAWWPRLQTHYDTANGASPLYLRLSPLPAVAAAIQRNAAQRGIWTAPANIQLAATLRPSQNFLDFKQLINDTGVYTNLIRSFAGKGVFLWGCRTLLNDETSPWRYIQTRLLVNSVECYLTRLARAYLFETNNIQTWTKLKGHAWTWLRQQWLEGAFFGTVEEEAFTVAIGLNETMSEDEIKAGIMVLTIQLALLAPAEFIEISLTLDTRDSSTSVDNRRFG